jgi:hypothetical protein
MNKITAGVGSGYWLDVDAATMLPGMMNDPIIMIRNLPIIFL